MVAFRQGLGEAGFVDQQNATIQYRWAGTQLARLPALAMELVNLPAAVIVTIGSTGAARAAKAATPTIPIVFAYAGDPVQDGLVASIGKPGGNLTGVADLNTSLGGKRLSLLRDLVPNATKFGFLCAAPTFHTYAEQKSEILAAGRALGREIIVQEIRTDRDYEAAFAAFAQRKVDALVVGAFTFNNLNKMLALAGRYKLPTLYPARIYAEAGGLMSYAASGAEVYHQVGVYTGRILKGTKPAELPVVQPTKFTLTLNLKTARTLGLEIPPIVIGIADEVIE